MDLLVSADAVLTLFYQARKSLTTVKANTFMEILLQRLRFADVTEAVIARAFRLGLADLEDAIQAAAALEAGIGVLVSRDAQDFKGLKDLQVLSPDIALAALEVERSRKGRRTSQKPDWRVPFPDRLAVPASLRDACPHETPLDSRAEPSCPSPG